MPCTNDVRQINDSSAYKLHTLTSNVSCMNLRSKVTIQWVGGHYMSTRSYELAAEWRVSYNMVLIHCVLVLASTSSEYSYFAVTFRKSLQTCVSVHLNLSFDMYRRERSSFGYPVCPGLLLTKFPISKTNSFPSTLFLRIYLQSSMGPVLVDLQG